MTLDEIMREVHHLSDEELHHLRNYIDQIQTKTQTDRLEPLIKESPEESIRQLDTAFAEIREGLTQEQIDEMIEAMNAEYIEPFVEDEWKD